MISRRRFDAVNPNDRTLLPLIGSPASRSVAAATQGFRPTPIASEAQVSNLQACGDCDMRLARRIGAELPISGTVQKVSNLILNMNIYVRDASSGTTIAAMSADMRGNTDETWSRTLDWLVRNRLLAPGYGLQR